MINKMYIQIFEESVAPLQNTEYNNENGYTLNENNVLLHDDEPVEYNTLASTLMTLNIGFSDIIKCPKCNEWTTSYHAVHTYHNRQRTIEYICNDCLNNDTDYFQCYDCGEWYDENYSRYVYRDQYICDDCGYEDYAECRNCGELIDRNSAYYCDDCDEYFCEDCWDDHYHEDQLLYDYHSFRDWKLHSLDNETPEFYIGHELEIDDGNDMANAVETIKKVDGICMHDGSLSYQGIEFISHPLSYKYMLSLEDKYRETFDHLKNLGYRSHDTSTCGLHFHVTRPENSKVVDRIILFMETYKEEIIKLSRRQSSELNRWSRFLSDKRTSLNEKVIKSLDYIVENKDTCDRYMALNLTNRNTIEFRFFKGTLNYETFMADFEFIYNLVHHASNLELPIEKLTWTLVTSEGKFLPQYIEENNMQSDRPIVDYSKELLVEFNKAKEDIKIETDNLLREILKVIGNKARSKNNTSTKIKETYSTLYKYTDCLGSLVNITNSMERVKLFDYYALDNVKESVRYIKGRLGK